MKSLRIYLGVVALLLIVALGFGVYVWYVVQSLHTSLEEPESTERIILDTETMITITE